MRQCTQCQRSFKPRNGRQVTCSDECASERHIAKTRERRAQHTRKIGFTRGCVVCGATYQTRAHNQIYCPREECKAEGLRRAIERQRVRRELAKVEGGKVHG